MHSRFLANMSWILIGNISHAVLAFLLNILTARILTTDDFGLLNYAASLISFLSAVATLGLNGVITRMFAEDEKNAGLYLSTGIIMRLSAGIIAIIVLLGFLFVGESNSLLVLIALFQTFGVAFGAFDLFVYWFRYKNKAKVVAVARFIGFGVAAIVKLAALMVLHNIELYALGISLETLVMVGLLLAIYSKDNRFRLVFSRSAAKKMLKISYPFIFSAIMMTVYGQTDKVMLKSMVDNSSVAYYSVALTLAGAFSIIPSALIEGFRPEIMSGKFKNEALYLCRVKQVYALVFWLSIGYSFFVAIFAKPIVLLLYGEKYLPTCPALGLIVWYSAFSYLGSINNMYLVAENKTIWVQIMTFFGALLNVILNLLMIPNFGIIGAAGASLLTQIATNIFFLLVIPGLRPQFQVMLQGIMLRGIGLGQMFVQLKDKLKK